jgi:hypothetical protein
MPAYVTVLETYTTYAYVPLAFVSVFQRMSDIFHTLACASTICKLAVLKLKYIIILSTQERKYETKTFKENFAKEVRTCRSRKREA